MYAIIKDGKISSLINQPRPMIIGDTQYPAKIFSVWSADELKNIGIIPVTFDDTNKKYDEAKRQYKLNGVVGQAILGPYSPGSDAVARTHLSQRSGWFE